MVSTNFPAIPRNSILSNPEGYVLLDVNEALCNLLETFDPYHKKTRFLPMQKQRRRYAVQ